VSLLELRIGADYRGKAGVLRDVRLEIEAGEILGLVGRSGEGKSTIAAAILGLLGLKGGACHGEIIFRGPGNGSNVDLLKVPNAQMRRLRGRHIALVPQSPLAALNPTLRLESHIQEAWRAHTKGNPACIELLESVSLPPTREFLRQYPSSLSAGMAQRFLIALAILHHPALLIADEPTSALDTITQSDILALFRRLNRERKIAILYISHDLASVASLCHRVAILQRGEIVESGPVEEIFYRPRHEYTRRLVAAIPKLPELFLEGGLSRVGQDGGTGFSL
jgi:ABC-type dipeptide/oligopeptide/nickel transport system ATPase component